MYGYAVYWAKCWIIFIASWFWRFPVNWYCLGEFSPWLAITTIPWVLYCVSCWWISQFALFATLDSELTHAYLFSDPNTLLQPSVLIHFAGSTSLSLRQQSWARVIGVHSFFTCKASESMKGRHFGAMLMGSLGRAARTSWLLASKGSCASSLATEQYQHSSVRASAFQVMVMVRLGKHWSQWSCVVGVGFQMHSLEDVQVSRLGINIFKCYAILF